MPSVLPVLKLFNQASLFISNTGPGNLTYYV